MKYLFDLPSDYGGLGEILDDLNYENLNLYEHKYNKNKNIPPIEIINGQCFVPLESKRETLNNINGNNNVNNFHPLNNINHVPGIPPYPMNPLYYQMWMRTNYPMPEIEQSMIATKETE